LITVTVNCIGQNIESILCQPLCTIFSNLQATKLDVYAAKIELGKAYFLQAVAMIEKLRAINRACGGESVIAESIFLLIKLFHLSLSLAHTRSLFISHVGLSISIFSCPDVCVCFLRRFNLRGTLCGMCCCEK
jgi:hypothetical protein